MSGEAGVKGGQGAAACVWLMKLGLTSCSAT